jgi:hypothetical protein
MYELFDHEILQFMPRYTVMFKASAVLPSLFFQLLENVHQKYEACIDIEDICYTGIIEGNNLISGLKYLIN